jgi:hypothetical protein
MAGFMRTSNPALNEKAFKGQVAIGEAMTLQGTPSTRRAYSCSALLQLPHGLGDSHIRIRPKLSIRG